MHELKKNKDLFNDHINHQTFGLRNIQKKVTRKIQINIEEADNVIYDLVS